MPRVNRVNKAFPSPEDRWIVMRKFIEEYGLVRQHIDSFNRFIERGLKEIVRNFGTVVTPRRDIEIKILDVEIGEPTIMEIDGSEHSTTPMECRLRDFTYQAPLKAKIAVKEHGIESSIESDVLLGYLPIMLRSKADPLARCFYEPEIPREECERRLVEAGEDPRDPGGYFIINGSERIIVMQEDQALNRILVDRARAATGAIYSAKIISSYAGLRYQVILDMHKDGTLQVSMPRALSKIPFAILMRALGLESDRDIVLAVSSDPEIQQHLIPSLTQAREINTVEDALDYIGSRYKEGIGKPREHRIRIAEREIDHHLFPHLGTKPEDRLKKALLLGQMANRVLELYLGRRQPDDKDHYGNKRILLAGDLIAIVFRIAFRSLINDLRQNLERIQARGKKPGIRLLIRHDTITNRLREALATGNWPGQRTGVSQILDRTNWLSMLSHLRRIVSPLSRSQPHFEARDVHGTQWGRICPFETPEGPNCGLVKNLATMAYITPGVPEEPIIELAYKLGVIPAEDVFKKYRASGMLPPEIAEAAKVFVNGKFIGYHRDGEELARRIRELRRKGKIPPDVSVSTYKTQYFYEVNINTDAGRILRPVFVVENGELKYKPEHRDKLLKGEWGFRDLLSNGIVELLDAEEEENTYIALNPEDITKEHTHMEIWPAAILGVTASTIPYAEHSQSPRNTYQAAMAKQALGIYAANYQIRVDTRGHMLHYPEKPLVQTRMLDVIGFNNRPAGQNMIVAIMSFTGYNIEDAVIMNRTSIERGLARSTFFRLYVAEERQYTGGLSDRIEIPDQSVEGSRAPEAYEKLDADGIISPEVFVKGGEVLVGKTSPPRFMEEYREFGTISARRRDTSVTMRHGEKGVVESVLITENSDGFKLVKVKVRDLRIPEIGDKFTSRHGQKGVIGLIVPEADMPFTSSGVKPDIIFSPHSIPSRMTISHLIELVGRKTGALSGRQIDGTSFESENEKDIRKELLSLGLREDSTETMYDGITGERMEVKIFVGPMYYLKLKHMVSNVIHARATGPIQLLTRQPTEGRAREGGLRLGEMEKDTFVAHGAASVLKERFDSDKVVVPVDETSGILAIYDMYKKQAYSPVSGEEANISYIEIAYAFKLLLDEFKAMGIYPKLVLKNKF